MMTTSETERSPETQGSGKTVTIVLAAALLCATLSTLGIFLIVSLIPLQWVYYKAGFRAAAICSGLSTILMVGVRIVVYRSMSEQVGGLAVFDMAIPLSMIGALGLMNLRSWREVAIPSWLRISLAYALIALAVGTTGSIVFGAPESRLQMEKMLTETFIAFGMPSVDAGLLNAIIDLTVSSIPAMLLITVVFNWYVTTWFWRRKLFQWSASSALAKFRVAEYMVWPLLVSLAGIAAGRMVSTPSFLNTLLIIVSLGCAFLYGLQGLGIIAAFFERRQNPGMRRIALPLVCMILFLVPGVNFFVLVALPLLGVLEIWIRMRPDTQTNKVS